MSEGKRFEIEADPGLDVPARILDLFSAQGRVPAAFSFHGAGDGMRIQLTLDDMPEMRRAILVAKLQGIAGVRRAREGVSVLRPAP